MPDTLQALMEQVKSVSNPLRMRVLALLNAGELCVCQVAECLAVPASSVSEALRELRRAGFVTERKEGRWVYVSIVASPSRLLQALLFEAENLPECRRDRARAAEVTGEPIQAICQKHQPTAIEASHV